MLPPVILFLSKSGLSRLISAVSAFSLVPKLRLETTGFGLIFLVLLLSACDTPQPIGAATAQAVLTKAWQADQHTIWEIEWPAAPSGGSLTVESWRAGPHYRLEILEATAPDLVGQTLIFDGQTAWSYNRFDLPQPSPQPGTERLSPVTDAFAVIKRLLDTPPASATQEAAWLSFGLAQKISLTFANRDSLSLWRDEATGLPVRIEFVVGGQPASLRARSLKPLSDPPEGLFKPQ